MVKHWIAALSVMALLAGCLGAPTYDDARSSALIQANQEAVQALLAQTPLTPSDPVLVTTLVNVDNLMQSSRLGRLISEQMAARLSTSGYRVTDIRLRQGVLMRSDTGELGLTREAKDVLREQEARAIIVGTYAEAMRMVYVTLKVLDARSGQTLAAHSYALPLDEDNLALLRVDHRR